MGASGPPLTVISPRTVSGSAESAAVAKQRTATQANNCVVDFIRISNHAAPLAWRIRELFVLHAIAATGWAADQ
jgi:hypothetical protein